MKKGSFVYGVIVLCLTLATSVSQAQSTLLPDEQNTVEVFQKSASKVVFVSRLAKHKSEQVPDGAGTGIVWDNKGFVVTNYHVIKGADKVEITVGKMTVPAEIVGKEPRQDIAVLKVKSPQALDYLKTIQPFNIVPLKDIKVGQKAIAIGNPFGLDHSLSKGIVSALGRNVPGAGGLMIPDMIQTDTSINPGNSGGPLLNSAGELVGINTTIFSKTGVSTGIGFAIPADGISQTVNQLITNGRVTLSGIGIQQVTPKAAYDMGVKKGILISNVLPNSPAAKAKLQGLHKNNRGRMVPGDVIVALNAREIDSYDEMYSILTKVKVGEKVTVSIQRGNKQMDVTMTTIDVGRLDSARKQNQGKFLSA